jgi:hypothetical protein|tara:strand:- start:7258 stop:8433 length:1176 start_codon:yes stop_codon:yes gene_type:complete
MNYKSILNIFSDFNTAVSNTEGLNKLYMFDESEINKIRNYNYPVCIIEPPNSRVSDINRAYEEYEIVCFILKPERKDKSDVYSISLYDDCMSLFHNMMKKILAVRDGEYILNEGSIQIERISKFGVDLTKGVKLTFTLLAPSALGFASFSVPISLPYETNLKAFYHSSSGVLVNSNSILWEPLRPLNSTLNITHLSSDNLVSFDGVDFVFESPVTFSNSEALQIPSISFSSASFTVFAKVFISQEAVNDSMTLFSFSKDAQLDYFRARVKTGGGVEGDLELLVDDDTSATTESFSSVDLRPYGNSSELKAIALVNDHANQKTILYTETDSYELSSFRDDVISNSKFIFGATELNENFVYQGFVGKLKSLAIYDEAVSPSNVNLIMNKLKTL